LRFRWHKICLGFLCRTFEAKTVREATQFGGFMFKKIAPLFLSLILCAGIFVPSASAQTRATQRNLKTLALIGGGAAVGAIVAGKKGAAIGAGGTALYAFNRRDAVRHYSPRTRSIGTVLGGTALGAGIGGVIGHGKGAAIGAAAGAASSYIYTRRSSRYPYRYGY
jgi:hypothetical protein